MQYLSIIALLLVFGWCNVSLAQPIEDQFGILMQQGNAAKAVGEDQKALEFFTRAVVLDSTNKEALFSKGYQLSRVGWLEDKKNNDDLAMEYFQQCKKVAQKLYYHHPNSFEANFLMAGAAARIAKFDNAKGRVYAAWDIKKYGDIAYRLNPEDADVLHMLAWWNFEMSKPTWFERSAAKVLFGGLPTGASVDNAINYMHQALEKDSSYMVYWFDLALFYARKGQEEKALELLDRLDKLEVERPEDPYYVRDSKNLRAEID